MCQTYSTNKHPCSSKDLICFESKTVQKTRQDLDKHALNFRLCLIVQIKLIWDILAVHEYEHCRLLLNVYLIKFNLESRNKPFRSQTYQ